MFRLSQWSRGRQQDRHGEGEVLQFTGIKGEMQWAKLL
jgi:hypothetical protein